MSPEDVRQIKTENPISSNQYSMLKKSKNLSLMFEQLSTQTKKSQKADLMLKNTSILKDRIEELKNLETEKGREKTIKEMTKDKINEKVTQIVKKHKLVSPKKFPDFKILELLKKKKSNLKLQSQNNQTKFDSIMGQFKNLESFIDLKEYMKKINITQDADFKEFENHFQNKFLKHQEKEESQNLKFKTLESFSDIITKNKNNGHLKEIFEYINDFKIKNNINNYFNNYVSNYLDKNIGENVSDLHDEFYERINGYLKNEQKLFQNDDSHIFFDEGNIREENTKFKEKIHAQNEKTYQQIKEFQNYFKNIGVNLQEKSPKSKNEAFYEQFKKNAENFTKTLKNLSMEKFRRGSLDKNKRKNDAFISTDFSQLKNKKLKLFLSQNYNNNSNIHKTIKSSQSINNEKKKNNIIKDSFKKFITFITEFEINNEKETKEIISELNINKLKNNQYNQNNLKERLHIMEEEFKNKEKFFQNIPKIFKIQKAKPKFKKLKINAYL